MSDKKYYWLKIAEHFFDSDEMIYLESLEKGDTYIKIWIKLLLKCLKDKDEKEYGFLKFSEKIPYDDSLLSQVLRVDINDLRVAMKYFQELNMIEVLQDKTIYLECVQKMIGKETDAADRMRKHREKKKLKQIECNNVTGGYVTSDANKEVNIEEEVESKNDKYESFSKCFYNILCDKVYLTYKPKEPNYAVWNNDFRLIIENDNVKVEDLKSVVKWVVEDDFWKNNIKSPAKLRKQFATLYNKMETKTGDKPHEWPSM